MGKWTENTVLQIRTSKGQYAWKAEPAVGPITMHIQAAPSGLSGLNKNKQKKHMNLVGESVGGWTGEVLERRKRGWIWSKHIVCIYKILNKKEKNKTGFSIALAIREI